MAAVIEKWSFGSENSETTLYGGFAVSVRLL